MKSFKLLVGCAFVAALLIPVFAGGVAHAQTSGVLQCVNNNTVSKLPDVESDDCDLAIKKEVSVNGGAFVDANTSAEAVQGNVGNSVVWKVTITNPLTPNPNEDFFPTGIVLVGDNLPAGVTYVSSSTSDGSTYDESADVWQFNLNSSTTYPVTLTINTTAASVGQSQNFAFLSGYACDGDFFFCEYSDANNENDGDQAWIEVSAAPVVLGESTPVVLAATGSGTTESLVAAGLILSTLGTLGYSRFARKNS